MGPHRHHHRLPLVARSASRSGGPGRLRVCRVRPQTEVVAGFLDGEAGTRSRITTRYVRTVIGVDQKFAPVR